MKKNFCDLCGEPALDSWPSMKVHFPNMQWRGNKTTPGSISATEGTWTPYVEARVLFDAHDMPRNTYAHDPDLCGKCIVKLLIQVANKISPIEPDRLREIMMTCEC